MTVVLAVLAGLAAGFTVGYLVAVWRWRGRHHLRPSLRLRFPRR